MLHQAYSIGGSDSSIGNSFLQNFRKGSKSLQSLTLPTTDMEQRFNFLTRFSHTPVGDNCICTIEIIVGLSRFILED